MKVYIVFNTGDVELDKGSNYGPWIDSGWLKKADAKARLEKVEE